MLPIVPTPERIMAMATRDDRHINVLMVNDQSTDFQISLDLSSILKTGAGTLWQFSAEVNDQPIQPLSLVEGEISIKLPKQSAILSQINLLPIR